MLGQRTRGRSRIDRSERGASAPDPCCDHAARRSESTTTSASPPRPVVTALPDRSRPERIHARRMSVQGNAGDTALPSGLEAASDVDVAGWTDGRWFMSAPRTGWLRSRRRACTGRQHSRPSCPNEATHPKIDHATAQPSLWVRTSEGAPPDVASKPSPVPLDVFATGEDEPVADQHPGVEPARPVANTESRRSSRGVELRIRDNAPSRPRRSSSCFRRPGGAR
jgi:hypothetical protein